MSASTAASVSVVLVHGGFVDGSGWQGVYNSLRKMATASASSGIQRAEQIRLLNLATTASTPRCLTASLAWPQRNQDSRENSPLFRSDSVVAGYSIGDTCDGCAVLDELPSSGLADIRAAGPTSHGWLTTTRRTRRLKGNTPARREDMHPLVCRRGDARAPRLERWRSAADARRDRPPTQAVREERTRSARWSRGCSRRHAGSPKDRRQRLR